MAGWAGGLSGIAGNRAVLWETGNGRNDVCVSGKVLGAELAKRVDDADRQSETRSAVRKGVTKTGSSQAMSIPFDIINKYRKDSNYKYPQSRGTAPARQARTRCVLFLAQ